MDQANERSAFRRDGRQDHYPRPNVHRVEIDDESIWAVRVFTQSYREVDHLDKILDYLHHHAFPAEACISPNPVADFASDERILVTAFAGETRPEPNRRTLRRLGHLLSQLHSLPLPERLLKGSARHHLSASGGISDKCEAAKTKLELFKLHTGLVDELYELIDRLQLELSAIGRFEDLPLALVHPDFVPANVIEKASTSDHWTIIDWAGAGSGPRIISLGPLLMAAGARGKFALVNAVMAGYAPHVNLDISELDRLSAAIRAGPLAMACWGVAVGRKGLGAVVQGLPALFELVGNIASRVREMANET